MLRLAVLALLALLAPAAAQTPTPSKEQLRAACVEAQRAALDETVAKSRYLSLAREAVLRRCASLADIATVTAPPPAPTPTPPPAPPPPTSGDFATLAALAAAAPANTWVEIPNTRIPLVSGAEAARLGIHGTTGPRSVIQAWNSGASTGRALLVMGGGHADYAGNEVYQFDYATLAWSRVTEPSAYAQTPGVYDYPLSGPDSSHTYDGLVWVPALGEMLYWPGVLWTRPDAADPADGNWGKPRGVWAFNPATKAWRLVTTDAFKQDQPATALLGDGRVIVHVTGSSAIFDPATARYVSVLHERDYAEGNALYVPSVDRVLITNGRSAKWIDAGNTTVTHFKAPSFRYMNPCLAWHAASQRVIAWDGTGDVRTLEPASETWRSLPMSGRPASDAPAGVFGRCAYVAEADAFVGYNDHAGNVWLFRPDLSREVAIQAPAKTFAEQAGACGEGRTCTIAPGLYVECAILRQPNVTLIGTGVHLRGAACEDKAAFVVKATGITLEGFEVSDVRVGANGAAVRMEVGDLTLRRVHFHGNEMNLLSGNNIAGWLVIEDSVFGATNSNANLGHSLYAGTIGELIVRRSRFMGASNDGHLIKSRARKTTIEDSVIWQGDTPASLAIDLSQGGTNIVRRNVIQQGTRPDNADIIGVAKEVHETWTAQHLAEGYISDPARVGTIMHPEWPGGATMIEDNLILSDWQNTTYIPGPRWSPITIVSNGGAAPVTLRSNTIVWPGPPFGWQLSTWHAVAATDNRVFAGRAAAGLPAYPTIIETR